MNKFKGYLILSDIDGTITNDRGAFTEENAAAIRYFQSEGGLFTLATGRQLKWVNDWSASFVPNTYVSCINGAYLCSPDGSEVLFSRPMDDDFIPLANRIFEACPRLEWVTFGQLGNPIQIPRGTPITASLFGESPVYKMVFYAHRADSDEYAARIASLVGDRYLSMRSWINGIEVQLRGTGKGDSVRRLKEHLGERARTVIAVGDYENDLDMIRAADIGYAVANAAEPVRAAADRITVSNRESAIARIIEEIG
jgi:HAD superfamily hydrolase (TIGR01484 family)